MRFGVTLPNAGLGNDPSVLAELASDAEEAGWDGVFVWDAGVPGHEIAQHPDDPALEPLEPDELRELVAMVRPPQ